MLNDRARAVGVDPGSELVRLLIGNCGAKAGRPVVADGKSQQPFDGQAHGSDNAGKRVKDTEGLDDAVVVMSFTQGSLKDSIGDVTAAEKRGHDWNALHKDKGKAGVVAALKVRARLQVDYLRSLLTRTPGKDAMAKSSEVSHNQAKRLLEAVYREMCKRAERSVR